MKKLYELNATIKQVGIIFLEYKNSFNYSPNTFGFYQNRVKVIIDYFQDTFIDDINIETFENYLRTERKWKNTKKASEKTIQNVLKVLDEIIEFSKIFEIRYDNVEEYINRTIREKEEKFTSFSNNIFKI